MSEWQEDTIILFRDAREYAIQTGNASIHRACARAIMAVAASGGYVPIELRCYAQETNDLFGRFEVLPSDPFSRELRG